jgi:integrase
VQAKRQMAAGKHWTNNVTEWGALIFTDAWGAPLHQAALRRAFKTILRKAKLPDMRLYDLRHSHATQLLRDGVSPKIVAERLGHSSPMLVMTTYGHVLPDMQEQAVERLNKVFGYETTAPCGA